MVQYNLLAFALQKISELGRRTILHGHPGFQERFFPFSPQTPEQTGTEQTALGPSADTSALLQAAVRLLRPPLLSSGSTDILPDNTPCCQISLLRCSYLQILSRSLISNTSPISRFSLPTATRLPQIVQRKGKHHRAFELAGTHLLKEMIFSARRKKRSLGTRLSSDKHVCTKPGLSLITFDSTFESFCLRCH